MKRLGEIFIALLFITLAAKAADSKSIETLTLDERTVYSIPVSANRVTTISFPGPISAIDAAQVTVDGKTPAAFQIAHTKGSYFFSVRALGRRTVTNVNVRWNNKTYVIELIESDEPLYSAIFQIATDQSARRQRVAITPNRLLALLDKTKAFPFLLEHHPQSVAQVEHVAYGKKRPAIDYKTYEIRIEEVLRFDPEDTLVFRLSLTNKTAMPLHYSPDGFWLRVGERVYPQSISDASGAIPPNGETVAYFAVTGTPNGGRNDISLKNEFTVILEASPAAEPKQQPEPESDPEP
jgi:hypothetical protein